MKRYSLRLDPDVVSALRDLARQRAVRTKSTVSWADVVRDALASLLAAHTRTEKGISPMNEEVMTLVPHSFDDRGKPLFIDEARWREAVNIVFKGGYRPNVHCGLDRSTARPFAKALGLGLEQHPDAHPQLVALLDFLRGSGRLGFSTSRGYRRAR